MIDKEVKKKVIEDWQNAFPQLTMYAQNKFYKVVGPCVFGIELIKSPHTESYSPYFVLYPIWRENVKASLDRPIFLNDFKNKKGLQYDISYTNHSVFFDDLVNSIKNQTPLSFEGNVSFEKIITAIENSSQKPPLSAAPNSYLQAVLQEAKFKIALSISKEKGQDVLKQINNRNWDENSFNMWKVDLNKWLQSLQEIIAKRDDFLKQIEINKLDKKIVKLKSTVLT